MKFLIFSLPFFIFPNLSAFAQYDLKQFGAAGDGKTNDTRAFQSVAAKVNAAKGGTINIPKGIYIVGEQSFAGARKKAYSFLGHDILFVHDCKKVVIEGNGATIRLANGLHFGSFDPETGKVFNAPKGGFLDGNYAAQVGAILHLENNDTVIIRNLHIDGNREHLVIGGYYGDVGIQLNARGVQLYDNKYVLVSNVSSNNNGLDGFSLQNKITANTPSRYIYLKNVQGNNNGRTGVAYTGGNHLSINGGEFNRNGALSNSASGMDIEAEVGPASNGNYENCEFSDNVANGVVCDQAVNSYDHYFKNCKFIGTTSWALFVHQRRFRFDNCLIVGAVAGAYSAKKANDPDRMIFNYCTFSFDQSLSPNGKVYGNYIDFGGSGGLTEFNHCTFDGGQTGNVPYTTVGVTYIDCRFKTQNPKITSYPYGDYYGTTYFDMPHPNWAYAYCRFHGPWYLNGKQMPNPN